MSRVQGSLLLLALCLVSSTHSICNLVDQGCAMRGAEKALKRMIPGIPGVIETLEPLQEDIIEEETPFIKYVLSNVTMSGMSHCQIELLSFNPEELTYVYVLRTPRMVVTGDYIAQGTLGTEHIDVEGSLQITLDDYVMTFKGKNGRFIDENDNKLRLSVETYHIETEPKGDVIFENRVVRKGNKLQADSALAYLKDSWRRAGGLLRSATMDKFMSNYMEKLKVYEKVVPAEDTFRD